MTNRNRTVLSRAPRLAVLVAVLATLLAAVPVQAASAVKLEARPLMGGNYELGGWLAVSVTLVNDGSPTEGYLSAPSASGSMRRFVEMPAGARKLVTLYVEPASFQRQLKVTYEEPNGAVSVDVAVQTFEQAIQHVAIVGDPNGAIRAEVVASRPSTAASPIVLTAADIPERPEPLDGVGALVWASASGTLSEAQRLSIERWVADGGQLVVLGGPDWQARTAAFTEMLPLENLASVDGASLDAMADWAGGDPAALTPTTVSSGSLRDGARALFAGDGTILASYRALGAGRVVFVGADTGADAFRGWDGAPGMWARLVPVNLLLEQFGGGFPVKQEMQNSLARALQTLPTLEVPPVELLLAVIVGYILLIGPISYFVLRRVDRRELAWVTAPLLVVVFSASSYGLGRALKGSDVVANQVAVVRTSPVGAATVETYAGIFSPDRATYDLSVDADALMARLVPFSDSGVPQPAGDVVVEQGQPAHLRGLSIGVSFFQAVSASGIAEVPAAMTVTWRADDNNSTVGTVTNTSDTALSDVAFVGPSIGKRVGDLEPGASADFTIPATNFNGSSASDQIYGFGGFTGGNDEQRRIALRRNVIDALVGYAGFSGIDLGTVGSGNGPFLIGWREAEGPMPITVDGVQASRYVSSVEVLSVRPTIGTGDVTVRSSEMAVRVIGTAGEISQVEPGFVSIIDGSATFSLALPLEATGLVPSAVEIVAAPDASSLVNDPGSFAGFWPPGFTVEVHNPRTGDWTPLGDLSETSRFEIEDPADALTASGRIEVRVTGAVDQNFGSSQVFVGATVRGVIDE